MENSLHLLQIRLHDILPKLLTMTSVRLLRYTSFLSRFDYEMQFKKREQNQNIDCLSRAPLTHALDRGTSEVHQICAQTVFEISTESLTPKMLVAETEKDAELWNLKKKLQTETIS